MHRLSPSCALSASVVLVLVSSALAQTPETDFPEIPLPPPIEGLIGMPQPYPAGRDAHLAAVRREAERAGLPPDIADAVAQVESAYDPHAFGGVGEVGLMQIRPTTAAMLGYGGTVIGLFEPETNIRYGVRYLARAWRLADGDLCRALMKYRAGHGEERMTPLSAEYCRRVRRYLAAIGSPFGAGPEPTVDQAAASSDSPRPVPGAPALPPPRPVTAGRATADLTALVGPLQILPPQRPWVVASAVPVLPPRRPSDPAGTGDVLPPPRPALRADAALVLPPRRPTAGRSAVAVASAERPGSRSASARDTAASGRVETRPTRAAGDTRIRSISARVRPGTLRISTDP